MSVWSSLASLMKMSPLEASLGILAGMVISGLGSPSGCPQSLGGQTVDENEPQEAFPGMLADRAISGSREHSKQPPKQPTHTLKKHTDTFHKLPAIMQHPDEESSKHLASNPMLTTVPLSQPYTLNQAITAI